MMQCWRHRAAQKSEGRLAAACHCTYVTPTADTQLHGRFSCTPGHIAAAVKWSFLSAAVDVHMLQRAMQCAQGLSKVCSTRDCKRQTKPALDSVQSSATFIPELLHPATLPWQCRAVS